LVAVCVSAPAGVSAAKGQDKPAPATQPSVPVVAPTAAALPEAPDFEAKDLNGNTFHLRDFRGKAVVLNFWATFCVPCKTEMPWLDAFQKQYKDQGLVVLGISTFDDAEAMRKFANAVGAEYTMAAGDSNIEDLYPASGMPYTIYIDRNGKMVDKVTGLKKREVIEDEIKRILGSGAAPVAK
jgi:peroxiredoxin